MKRHQLVITLLTALFALVVGRAEAQWGATVIDVPNGKYAVLGNVYGTPYAIVMRQDSTCTTKRLYDRNGNWGNVIFHDHEVIEVATTSYTWCGYPITPLDTSGHTFTSYLGDGATRLFVNQGNPNVGVWGGTGDDVIASMIPPTVNGYSAGGEGGNDVLIGAQSGVLDGAPGDDVFCIAPNQSAAHVSGGDGGDIVCGATDGYDTIEWYDPNCTC